jgi:fucose permease
LVSGPKIKPGKEAGAGSSVIFHGIIGGVLIPFCKDGKIETVLLIASFLFQPTPDTCK